MPRSYRYYGTNTNMLPCAAVKNNLPRVNYHNQWRVVCKATSMAAANREAKSLGLDIRTFTPGYTSETGNRTELELCDKYGFIVCLDNGIGNNYVSIREFLGLPDAIL